MIQIRSLVKSYGSTVVLEIDSLDVGAGSTVLVGHNGAGKSTLLQIAAGLIRPTSGEITCNGFTAGSVAARGVVSFLPDDPALFDDMTVHDQMVYVARLNGLDEPHPRATALIDDLAAEDLLDRLPHGLSKGQGQKAGLLVGLSRPCEILLLDEPTTGLDRQARTAVVAAIGALAAEGVDIVISTHDEELIGVADTRVDLADGRIAAPESDAET